MILKGSQRGGGQDLAAHLMNVSDNEHVLVHEVRGFASNDLRGAFKEAEGISRGTKCRQYLFSLSLSPPEHAAVSPAEFERTLSKIEDRLGLQGQPRAVVFHEKEGRRHAHCVWSRIDAETMTARPMSFFKRKLVSLSRDLYLEHGWQMPRGIAEAGNRNPTNFSLAEWQQAKRQRVDPRVIKEALQSVWARSDNARSLAKGLEERGYHLARGDKRSFVVLGYDGEVHSLPRALGLKTKEVAARLGDGSALPSVADQQKTIAAKMTPAIRRHIAEARARFGDRSADLGKAKQEMTLAHRAARLKLTQSQQSEWLTETKARAARLPKGLASLWHRITGKYQDVRSQNEAEAALTQVCFADQQQALIERQHGERRELQAAFKTLRKAQAEQLLSLRREVGRYLAFERAPRAEVPGREPPRQAPRREDTGREHHRRSGLGLGLER